MRLRFIPTQLEHILPAYLKLWYNNTCD